MSKTYYMVSGGFDPVHEGHIRMMKAAADKSDGVIILLNSDEWLCRKKGKHFMSFNSRREVMGHFKKVVDVLGFDDSGGSACDGIAKAREKYPDARLIFANGGDRTRDNIPEIPTCKKYDVEMEFGVGGENKANSSSWILNKWNDK